MTGLADRAVMALELGPDVTERPTNFGSHLVWGETAGSIVLATRGLQLHPFAIRLPGQVYTAQVEGWLSSYDRELYALPVLGGFDSWRLIATRS